MKTLVKHILSVAAFIFAIGGSFVTIAGNSALLNSVRANQSHINQGVCSIVTQCTLVFGAACSALLSTDGRFYTANSGKCDTQVLAYFRNY